MTFRPTIQISRVLNLYVSNPAKSLNYCQRNQPNWQHVQCNRQPVRKFATTTKSSNTSTLSCKPKKSKEPDCKKYPMQGCKPARTSCDYRPDLGKCRKIEAPYTSYGDVFDNLYEPAPSECVDRSLTDLQPKELKEAQIVVLKPPPPRARPVDPALERKCLERGKDRKESEWRPFETKFTNPCPHCTVPPCKPRARHNCDIIYDDAQCTKTEAPYGSFTDCCPQFPDLQLSECDMAEIIARQANEEMEHKAKASDAEDRKTAAAGAGAPTKEAKQPGKASAQEDEKYLCPKPVTTKEALTQTGQATESICVSTKEALQGSAPSSSGTGVPCKHSDKLKDHITTSRTQSSSAMQAVESCSLWERICAFFRARPNCPAPDDWKKEKLRRRAEKAAAAAGLRLCEADTSKTKNTITVSKDTDVAYQCPPRQSAASPSSAASVSTKAGKSSEPKFMSPCCANIKSSTSSSERSKKKYSTFAGDRRLYGTYTQTRRRHSINNSNKRMFEHQIRLILANNLLKYSKTQPGHRLDHHTDAPAAAAAAPEDEQEDSYVGKIYQIRLTKSKNSLAPGGTPEDVYTTCYTCKFVPRSYVVNGCGGARGSKQRYAPRRIKFKRGRDAQRTCKLAKG